MEITESADTTVASPTQSQMAKKKLGFEGLFDSTDPNVTDIDDVIGLCSGQFLTQHQADMSPMFDEFWNLVAVRPIKTGKPRLRSRRDLFGL